MRRETFMRGVVVAFMIAVFGAVACMALKPLLGTALAVRAMIATCAGLYIVYLVTRSDEKSGRIAVPTFWVLATIVAWYAAPTLSLFLLTEAGMVWLVRSLYFHTGILSALLDLGLCAAGVLAAVAAANASHSIFLSVWSFFLVQALFTTIPAALAAAPSDTADTPEDRFHRAVVAAEAAVRRVHAN